jgi:hypothetical protein
MNLNALDNLTTRELMLIGERAGDLVESRLSAGIHTFFTFLAAVDYPGVTKQRWLVRRTQEDGPIVTEIAANFDATMRILKEVFPKIQKSGLTPVLHLVELDPEVNKDLLLTVFIETWPQSWEFLRRIEGDTLKIEEVLRKYGEKDLE